MHPEQEPLPDQDMELVYIAKKLSEAKTLEALFVANDIVCEVEPGEYFGGVVFQRVRIGACFYVKLEDASRARSLLTSKGYRPQPAPPAA